MTTTADLLPRIQSGDASITSQEVFEAVVRHMFAQGHRSMRWSTCDVGIPSLCAYKSETGDKCAVGCLIPDEQYNADFEGTSVTYLASRLCRYGFVGTSKFMDANEALLGNLQRVHDLYLGQPGFVKELKKLARRYDLDAEFIDSLGPEPIDPFTSVSPVLY